MQFFLTLLRFVLLGLNLLNFVVLSAYPRQISTSNKGKIEENKITSQVKNKKKNLCLKLELHSKDKIAKRNFSPEMCANCPFRDVCW
ncbi:MAG: hypothetical protein B6D55_02485 [Candidatus Omnitrophica bacterium 4484_70.2]|nr:MAG: hypothetical protein B6D55_02485 [Candidatus Omnitrophica bacterium 4484_70.2]